MNIIGLNTLRIANRAKTADRRLSRTRERTPFALSALFGAFLLMGAPLLSGSGAAAASTSGATTTTSSETSTTPGFTTAELLTDTTFTDNAFSDTNNALRLSAPLTASPTYALASTFVSEQNSAASPLVEDDTSEASVTEGSSDTASEQDIDTQIDAQDEIALEALEDVDNLGALIEEVASDGEQPAIDAAAQLSEREATANVVPPYTDRLRGPEAEPIFNLSQTAYWIIVGIALIIAALFFAWLIHRILTKALSVDEHEADDIFHTNEKDSYAFDDEEASVATPHALLNDDERTDEHDHEDEEEMAPKGGFMSRLFSRAHKEPDHDEASMFAPSDHRSHEDTDNEDRVEDDIIDVEPEPVGGDIPVGSLDPLSMDSDAADEEVQQEVSEESLITVSLTDDAPEVSDTTDDDEEEPDFPAQSHSAPMPLRASGLTHHQSDAPAAEINTAASDATGPMPLYLNETLERLQTGHETHSQSINQIERTLSDQQSVIDQELGAIRTEASEHREQLDKALETRFEAISTSVETGLAETRNVAGETAQQVAREQINQNVDSMSTEELKAKIVDLDQKLASQSQTSDNNFNRLMQKLETLSTPVPQLSKLANDTSELKTRLSALQRVTEEKPSEPADALPIKIQEENSAFLRKVEASLSEHHRSLNAFREENRTLSTKFDGLNDRIDRMERDIQVQQSSLLEVIERNNSAARQPAPQAGKINALGLLGDVPPAPIQKRTEDPQPREYTNGHHRDYDDRDHILTSTQPEPVEPEPVEDDQPNVDPILVSLDETPARTKNHDASVMPLTLQPEGPAPAPTPIQTQSRTQTPYDHDGGQADSQRNNSADDRTIRPLTFNFSSSDKAQTDR